MAVCEACAGDGVVDTDCPDCDGVGTFDDDETCAECGGSGVIDGECPQCDGTGETDEEEGN